ncbi:uncharacterized protein LOC136062260 [Quercus suber]|uniref:uncharacterized protein LOC136062260 n=1 Tax=Quercus suber TaxID=58331 RepID=UPI0032DE8968
MVDQGSDAEIMYPDLYKGLNLRPEDLTAYSSLLVSFDEKVVILTGQIRLPIQTSSEVVEIDFIVVDAYSPTPPLWARPSFIAQLPTLEKEELLEFLRRNVDVFAWNAYEAPGVDPSFICHHLNVNPTVTPKKQPLRCSSENHSKAVRDEVKKLKQVGAIKEVFYPEWLANTVVVKKKSGKWRVCVDFTVCVVDATVGHPQMSFLDAFQGYR